MAESNLSHKIGHDCMPMKKPFQMRVQWVQWELVCSRPFGWITWNFLFVQLYSLKEMNTQISQWVEFEKPWNIVKEGVSLPQISVVFTNRHCDVRDKAGVIKKSSTQQFTSNNKKTKKLFTSKYKTLLMKCECLKIPLVSMFRPLFTQPSRWCAKVSKHAHLW